MITNSKKIFSTYRIAVSISDASMYISWSQNRRAFQCDMNWISFVQYIKIQCALKLTLNTPRCDVWFIGCEIFAEHSRNLSTRRFILPFYKSFDWKITKPYLLQALIERWRNILCRRPNLTILFKFSCNLAFYQLFSLLSLMKYHNTMASSSVNWKIKKRTVQKSALDILL